MRAKRIFGKLRADATELTLSDTLENCHDLLWFLIRYPHLIKKEDLKYLKNRSEAQERHADLVKKIADGKSAGLKLKLAIPARKYQEAASNLAYHTRGLILGDEVGLGKTVSAIGLLVKAECRPALVVTLTHLPEQWEREINRFLPGLKIHISKKAKPVEFDVMPDVIIMNYHKMSGWAGYLAGKIKTIIFDEGHELRTGSGSGKYHAASVIAEACDFRMALTGTPIFNNGSELWNLARIINPRVLGSFGEFQTEWCGTGMYVKDPRAFGSYLRETGLFLRRTKKDVGRELPPFTIVPQQIEADLNELDKVKTSVTEMARILLRDGASNFDKMHAAQEISWKLREATGMAKAPYVAEFVKMLLDSEEKVMIGAWHHAVHKILNDRLKEFKPVMFTGEESPVQKQKSLNAFIGGDSRIFQISNRAGQGLDGLQRVCSAAVLAEPDWSPAIHEQFFGRLYRDGQPNPVFGYAMLADCGSDPVIADTVGIKLVQLDGIRNPDNTDPLKQVDPERMKKLAADYLKRNNLELEEELTLEGAF
jgi:SNF2 family DNA or RNA helicase